MATGMREKTTVIGGVLKRIWYAMTGATQGAELMSVDDTGKFQCVSEQISGLAGTGNRMVVADSNGNLSTSGEVTGMILARGGVVTNSNGFSGSGSSADIKSMDGYGTPTTPTYTFWYNALTGIYHPSADNLGITTGGVGRAVFNSSGVTIPSLAGTGNRAVYSDALGVLTNTSSDVRVKKNIENITNEMNVLDVLKSIRGVTYNWDNTIEGYEGAGEQQEIGVIAQEIEQYIPQVVGENATGYKSVDYAKLVAFLIETNKALLEKVEILESKVV